MDYFTKDKPYNSLNEYYKIKYGKKIAKLTLNQNVTCPNIDGTKSKGGCIFCLNGAGEFTIPKLSIKDQLLAQKEIIEKKWPNTLFIPYFQSNTNTYAKLDVLKNLFEKLLNYPKVVGLAIATRPDALSDEVIDYLDDLNKRTFLTIELGLQSSNDDTLKLINRGHDVNTFINAVEKLHKKNIFVVAHIINGLPNDTYEDMINTAILLNKINIDGVKIHMLYINKNTPLENYYKNNSFHILTKDEYIDIVTKQLEYLKDTIVIERITGDPVKEELIEPTWLLKKFVVLNDIDKKMVKDNIYQGDLIN